MNRTKQIKQAAEELAVSSVDAKTEYKYNFQLGAKWADRTMIEWLKSINLNDYVIIRVNTERFSDRGQYLLQFTDKFFEDIKQMSND